MQKIDNSGEPMCFAKKSDVAAGFRINDVAMLQIRDYTEPLYAKPPSVEVLLEAANELLSQLSFDDEEGLFEHSEHVIKLRNAIDALNAYSSKPKKHLDN
jgi:hypothetical protein